MGRNPCFSGSIFFDGTPWVGKRGRPKKKRRAGWYVRTAQRRTRPTGGHGGTGHPNRVSEWVTGGGGVSTSRPAPRTKLFEGPNSRVFREKSGSRPKKIHCEKVEKRAFWGRDFFTIEKKKIQKVGRNPCFSGSIFFDGTLDFATGPSDQTFWWPEFTGFSGVDGRDFFESENKTFRKVGRNPCFSGSIFFDGTLDYRFSSLIRGARKSFSYVYVS